MPSSSDYRKLFNACNHSAIILDDLNTYSTLFGADSTDDRGRLLEELIEEHNLVILNTGAGTFVRPSREMSDLDVAMASANISRIANSTVLDDKLGSDHLQIVITVNNPAAVQECSQSHWMDRKADWNGFKDDYKRLLTEVIITNDVTSNCNHIIDAILQAAEKNVPVFNSSKNPTRMTVPYWTDECTAAVKERNKEKNKMQQTRYLTDRQTYYKLKIIVRRVVNYATKQHWRDYCNTLGKTSKKFGRRSKR